MTMLGDDPQYHHGSEESQPPIARQELLELYKIAIEEYRFEVKLNWDRMRYYLVVNSAMIALATGLIRDSTAPSIKILSGAVFVVGFAMAILGIFAIQRGQEYYRQTIFKKTIIEELLGYTTPLPQFARSDATLAIGTTSGQKDTKRVLSGWTSQSAVRRMFKHRVVSYFMWLLVLSAAVDAAGAFYAFMTGLPLVLAR